ncbi:Lrp/AsnC family transcriptional regulator [Pseudomonas syringae pv. actinidiae]|uniref:Lrp/AsnC family transcriptional regulator n=25 Tax=Pseudomonas syringae group TaxID=136849 RepID=A0AAW4E4T9_PSESX|nr:MULTISPECIES: Lrp/AsnC family transcriptional regulator [Pseudomonas]EPN38199.1 AsnC family transcriptional regulator [Pseudomonas syringae pv. actinidiae ICMP 19096]EPN56888.1 AsnC family transcriptional regulator [Pseudomonas syringae pv. actinidiae ICMP 19079]EPN85874.1 AsnC family transcriptional regulator [Pseudomonas syringae pv. actinidiae ICMP 19101]AAO53819.1 transcriptional regulator, AsnC family [Pseudomonas syringae pv. tomato str. DC3000]AKT28156.1 transcriptional regulator [Ps
MDKFDRAILDILQTDCTRSVADIAERIGLGSTACWRRIQKLEESGIIDRRVALLNPQQLNVSVSVFAAIRTNQHNAAWLEKFHAAVGELPEVVECYRMAGDTDYMLRIVVADIAGYDAVYKQLISIPGISDVSSSFAMEQIKFTTGLPLQYASFGG